MDDSIMSAGLSDCRRELWEIQHNRLNGVYVNNSTSKKKAKVKRNAKKDMKNLPVIPKKTFWIIMLVLAIIYTAARLATYYIRLGKGIID